MSDWYAFSLSSQLKLTGPQARHHLFRHRTSTRAWSRIDSPPLRRVLPYSSVWSPVQFTSQNQSPTPSTKQRNRACSTLPTPSTPSPCLRLNEKGVNVSASGISVKTGKHMTREDYLDATQRSVLLGTVFRPFPPSSDLFAVHSNFVKAIQTSTTSVTDSGGMAQPNRSQSHSPSIKRSSTSGSNRSVDSTKKKPGLFGIRKSASKHSDHST